MKTLEQKAEEYARGQHGKLEAKSKWNTEKDFLAGYRAAIEDVLAIVTNEGTNQVGMGKLSLAKFAMYLEEQITQLTTDKGE